MLDKNIITLRKNKKISQEKLAEVLNTTRQAVSKWERGESYPDIEKLKDMATYFNVSIDYLLDFDIESVSLKNYIKKLATAYEEKDLSLDVNEIKIMVSQNNVNFNLLIYAISYLLMRFIRTRENDLAILITDYAKRALLFYQENNSLDVSENDLKRAIVIVYSLNEQYDLAKDYILENHVYNEEENLAICQLELGNFDEAQNLASHLFLKSAGDMISANILRCRLLIKKNKTKEAYDLTRFSIDFIKMIGKTSDLFINIIYIFSLFKVVCEKHLKLNYEETLNFLKNNREAMNYHEYSTDSLKYYYEKKTEFITTLGSLKEEFKKSIEKDFKQTVVYKDSLLIYQELFGD